VRGGCLRRSGDEKNGFARRHRQPEQILSCAFAQTRERVFILGARRCAPKVPQSTHCAMETGSLFYRPAVTAAEAIERFSGPEYAEPEEVVTGRWAQHLHEVPPGGNYKAHTGARKFHEKQRMLGGDRCLAGFYRGLPTMRYDVCISFEGTYRAYARRLANALSRAGIDTFFDEFEQARLWGAFLLDELGKIYFSEAYLCIILISQAYYSKMYTDRERKSALLQQAETDPGYILPIKMDDEEVHISLRGLAYLDRKNITFAKVVSLIQDKLRYNTNKVKDEVHGAMARENYAEAARHAKSYLDRIGYSRGEPINPKYGAVMGLLIYNLACCLSRQAENKRGREQDALLDEGVLYGRDWLMNPVLRPSTIKPAKAVALFNTDDDLLKLRVSRTNEIKEIYAKIGRSSVVVKTSPTGKSVSGGGCVIGDTLILTGDGERRARSLGVGDTVLSPSADGRTYTPAPIKKVVSSIPAFLMTINDRLTVSPDQHFLEEILGWTLSRHLQPGMHVLCGNGCYEPIILIAKVESEDLVFGFSIGSETHAFIANGFVCHNEEKI
jgi:hypothetical protein